MSVSLSSGTLIKGSAQESGFISSSFVSFNVRSSLPAMLFTGKFFT